MYNNLNKEKFTVDDLLNLNLSDDILFFIAEQIKSNIRQLEGIIKKLQAYTNLHSNNITLPLVQSYIRDIISEELPDPVTVEKIVEEVSRTYNVSVDAHNNFPVSIEQIIQEFIQFEWTKADKNKS